MEVKSSIQLNKGLKKEVEPAKLMEGLIIRTMQKDLEALQGKRLFAKEGTRGRQEKVVPPDKLPVVETAVKPSPVSQGLAKKIGLKTKKDLLRFVSIGLAVLVLIGAIGGFIYWRNYFRPAPLPAVTHYECQEFQCVSLEGESLDQCQTNEDCQSLEPVVPEPLIPVGQTQTIELALGQEKWLLSKLEIAADQEQASTTFRHILIKLVGEKEEKYMDLATLLPSLEAVVPENILQAVSRGEIAGENYTLFFYSQAEGNRLGLIIAMKEDSLDLVLRFWEETMKTDLKPLHLGLKDQPVATEEFLDNIYQGVAIRYINFPYPDLSIDYAIIDNQLIIATSRESIYAVIDALLPMEVETKNELETSDETFEPIE